MERVEKTGGRTARRDAVTAVVLLVAVFALCLGGLDNGHALVSDDFAAYLLEGKAIAEGRLEEQTALNARLHPTKRNDPGAASEEPLVYVWGLPLILSFIVRLVGYSSGTLIYYKLPTVVCFALFCAVLYLFYRRRFSYAGSLFLTALFAVHIQLVKSTNTIQTDIPCLFLSMLSLLLFEVFCETRRNGFRAVVGALLGAALWAATEMRLNGVTLCYVLFLAHGLRLLRERPEGGRAWAACAAPYGVYFALLGISLCVFPAATSNTSDIASGPNSWILNNILYYDKMIAEWTAEMLPGFVPGREYARFAFYALALAGMAADGIRRNLHMIVWVAGTYGVLYLLPYVQDLRYLYNILPLLVMFAAYGARSLALPAARRMGAGGRRALKAACFALMLLVAGNMALHTMDYTLSHGHVSELEDDAYSPEALDIYRYVRENIEEDAVTGFDKPRVMFLNTGRMFITPGVNGHLFKDCDYVLIYRDGRDGDYPLAQNIWPELWDELTPVYSNGLFSLYEVSEAYQNAP